MGAMRDRGPSGPLFIFKVRSFLAYFARIRTTLLGGTSFATGHSRTNNMKAIRIALFFALLSLLANAQAQSIDASASSVTFKIGNMKINTVDGKFSGMKGSVAFDPADPASAKFSVCVDAATVSSGNKSRDKSLRSDSYFDVEKYPTICISSTTVEKTGTGFLAKGKLSMHGVTKEVDIPFTYADRTFTGAFTLNRMDFGVGPNGTFMVDEDVAVSIVCKLK